MEKWVTLTQVEQELRNAGACAQTIKTMMGRLEVEADTLSNEDELTERAEQARREWEADQKHS